MVNEDNRSQMLKRLARIEGQVRGIQKLILLDDMDCEKVAQQMSAARKALDKAAHNMIACMVEQELAISGQEISSNKMERISQLISKYA